MMLFFKRVKKKILFDIQQAHIEKNVYMFVLISRACSSIEQIAKNFQIHKKPKKNRKFKSIKKIQSITFNVILKNITIFTKKTKQNLIYF